MGSRMGRAIVANSSMQLLLKQSPTAVDVLTDVFKLTSEESKRLGQFPVGKGLFFAGQNHVHVQIAASQSETNLITTNPNQVQEFDSGNILSSAPGGQGVKCAAHFNYNNKGAVIFDTAYSPTKIPSGVTQVGFNVALVGEFCL